MSGGALRGKVAVVTGAGRGIGRGCAAALARDGATLVLNDAPGSADLASARAEVEGLGAACHAIEADVFTREGARELVDAAVDLAGSIDILVSNPAFSRRAPFLEFDPALFERVIGGTLTAGFHLSQLAARRMIARGGGGKIVFISSVQAEMPFSGSVAYNAAKAGLNHMMRTIAAELCQHRIHVNAIEPGWIDTPGERATFGEELLAEQAAKLPWGRLGNPADIGGAVAFLCSDAADYVTGSVLVVDGGFRLKDCRPQETISPR